MISIKINRIILIFALTILSHFTFAKSNVFQKATLYLNEGKSLEGELLVYKMNVLHNEPAYTFKQDGEREKFKFEEIDSVLLGSLLYTKIEYTTSSTLPRDKGKVFDHVCFVQKLVQGSCDVYIDFWINDYGYTFVNNKADYLVYDFHIIQGKEHTKIPNPRSNISSFGFASRPSSSGGFSARTYGISSSSKPSNREHKYVIKKLRNLFPNCPALEISKEERLITYDDIPELVDKANKKECP